MTETRRTVTDPTPLLDNLTARRHGPGAPSPQAPADDAERRRRERGRADQRATNRAAWSAFYRTVAERLRGRALELEDRARRLEAGGVGR